MSNFGVLDKYKKNIKGNMELIVFTVDELAFPKENQIFQTSLIFRVVLINWQSVSHLSF